MCLSDYSTIYPDLVKADTSPLAPAPEVAQAPSFRNLMKGKFFNGTVTEVTRERIAIKLKTDKIQVVPVGKTLRSGGYWEEEHPATYRLVDVKVGDRVEICCLELNGELRCETIRIDRRPGGRVPPCPDKNPHSDWKWHERANAYQDLEEKGIPLPARFDPKQGPGMLNGKPIQPWMLPPGVLPTGVPGVQPKPKVAPPREKNGG